MQANSTQLSILCNRTVASGVIKNTIPIHYATILFLAMGFLLVTSVIFLLLWKKQNIYGWTIFCEVLAMAFMILFVGIAHTLAREPGSTDLGSTRCIFIGAAAHFFYLSTFFWLVVINFDLWWTFHNLQPVRTNSKGWFRFVAYQFVGWGGPLTIVLIGLTLDHLYGIKRNPDYCKGRIMVPNYGQLNCYISKAAQGPYLFYPMGAMLGGNLVFFVLTVLSLYSHKKSTASVLQARPAAHSQSLIVYAKLFVVMGVTWIAEVVAWILHTATPKTSKSKIPWYWIVFDLVTLLQAIVIFIMFVCKRQVMSDLWHAYPRMRPLLDPITHIPCCGPVEEERRIHMHTLRKDRAYKSPVTIASTVVKL